MVEEGSDHVVAHGPAELERRTAFGADLAPAQHADEDLQERDGDRDADPEQAGYGEARQKFGQIDLAQRQVEQRCGNQDLGRRQQDSAHLARMNRVCEDLRQPDARRRIRPLWYGLGADLAIAVIMRGYPDPSWRAAGLLRPPRCGG
ncbi:hypothetical protein ACVI8L_004252 [Bradyrhizobium diazoefficiens]